MGLRQVAKRFIPATFVHNLRDLRASSNKYFIKLFAGTRFTSSLYYALFSRQFAREHQAVLRGRLDYWQSLKKIEKTCALLRRNTHRLEKGLIMRPRRPSFAADYILETVECFAQAVRDGSLETTELKWAADVLTTYFEAVTDTPKIARARELWEQVATQKPTESRSVPYPQQELPATDITPEQLHTLFKRRRSTRWFTEQIVAKDLINQAVNMASLAPSACNRQPFQFHLVQNSERAARIAGYAGGTVGFSNDIRQIIVVVGDLKAYPTERDRHCIYIDASLASMQLMLAFETLGISTCPINWPDIEFREVLMATELNLSVQQRPVMLLAFGYADPEGGIPYSAKKPSSVLMVDHES